MQYNSCNLINEYNVMNSMLWIQCYDMNEMLGIKYHECTVCKVTKLVLC